MRIYLGCNVEQGGVGEGGHAWRLGQGRFGHMVLRGVSASKIIMSETLKPGGTC